MDLREKFSLRSDIYCVYSTSSKITYISNVFFELFRQFRHFPSKEKRKWRKIISKLDRIYSDFLKVFDFFTIICGLIFHRFLFFLDGIKSRLPENMFKKFKWPKNRPNN